MKQILQQEGGPAFQEREKKRDYIGFGCCSMHF